MWNLIQKAFKQLSSDRKYRSDGVICISETLTQSPRLLHFFQVENVK